MDVFSNENFFDDRRISQEHMKQEEHPKSRSDETFEEALAAAELEINLEEIEPPVPPDGGWAWMVLLGSFICMFCVDGISFSYGIMLQDLQSSFECSTSQISLAGSLIVGFTLVSGPIVSAISNVLNFRTLVLIGSSVSFVSIASCYFTYDVNSFIVLFGFVTGISYGLIYLPAATIVSQWFAKRRATATGISTCGSSIGTTFFSYLLPKFIKMYSWRPCMLIMAAISLHCFAAGCMFIPLREYQRNHPFRRSRGSSDASEADETEATSPLNGNGNKLTHLEKSNMGSVAETGYLKHYGADHESSAMETLRVPRMSPPYMHNTAGRAEEGINSSQAIHQSHDLVRIQGKEMHQPPVVGINTVNRVVDEVLSEQHSRRRTVSVEPTADASVYVKHDQAGGDLFFASAVSLRPIAEAGVPVNSEVRQKIVRKLEREMDLPANRKDFFYSGSMAHVNEFLSSSNVNEYVRSVTRIPGVEEEAKTSVRHSNHVLAMLAELFDFDLFRSLTFIVLLMSSVFGLLGYPVPYTFLASEAQSIGYSIEESANLLVYLSAVNTVGRVAAGVISDWPCTDALFVNNAALLVSGAACVFLPVMPSYSGHVAYAVIFGLAIAAFVSLRIILLVEMLGLERLTNAFGFLLLFQGLAIMASPPILAIFYDRTKQYAYTFYLGGSCLILSAVMCFPLRQILRWERRQRGEVEPPQIDGCFLRLVRQIRDRLTSTA